MKQPSNKSCDTREFINSIYTQDLSNAFLAEQSDRICRIMDSQYFATILFSNRISKDLYLCSNNPSDFDNLYFQIQDKDVLMHSMVKGNTPVLYDDLKDLNLPGAHEFFGELNPLRPVSDCCYYPMTLNGRICGFNGIARADGNNKTFDAEDLAKIRHISALINESFIRSLYCESDDEGEAVLDAQGRVLQSGAVIEAYFRLIFGDKNWNRPCSGSSYYSLLFTQHLRGFLDPLAKPGSGFLRLPAEDVPGILKFKRITSPDFRSIYKEVPQVLVSLKKQTEAISEQKGNLDWALLHKRYGISSYDADIIDCIYRGLSDSDIAGFLRISEAALQRRMNDIYTKIGAESRSDLILSLI